MRILSTTILLLSMISSVLAQRTHYTPQGRDRAKQISGRYGGNEGICLFEDGKFLLYGYATAVFGTYTFEKDYLLFYPYKYDTFEVYAHQNPTLGDSTRMVFVGFEKGKTFAGFDQDSVRQVFNNDANCFDAPFVQQIHKNISGWEFYAKDERRDSVYIHWQYQNDKGYNDLIFVYNEPRKEYEDFGGTLFLTDGKDMSIALSNYGGEGGYERRETDNNWDDLLLMKQRYEDAQKHKDVVLANKHYGTFIEDLSGYDLDETSNQYILKNATENQAYYEDSPYQDNRSLRQYVKQQPSHKDSIAFDRRDLAHGSIFFTTCKDVERSYHYRSENEREQNNVAEPPIQLAPAPIPQIEHSDDSAEVLTEITDHSATFVPYATDKKDGFYLVEKINFADYGKTVLSTQPILTKSDIAKVSKVNKSDIGPLVEITFNETGKEKLKKVTKTNVGNYLAIVVNGKVISIPRIVEPIEGGSLQISGMSTVDEAAATVRALQDKK